MQLDVIGAALIKIFEALASLAVLIVGPIVAKKIRDREVRETLANIADAALVLAISKSKGQTFADLGDLIRFIVQGILTDPRTPATVQKDTLRAEQAAAAAVARAGLAGVQTLQVNADGTMVPVTHLPR